MKKAMCMMPIVVLALCCFALSFAVEVKVGSPKVREGNALGASGDVEALQQTERKADDGASALAGDGASMLSSVVSDRLTPASPCKGYAQRCRGREQCCPQYGCISIRWGPRRCRPCKKLNVRCSNNDECCGGLFCYRIRWGPKRCRK